MRFIPATTTSVVIVCLIGVLAQQPDRPPPADGAALFRRACSGCHAGDDTAAPSQEALAGRSPHAILDALTAGSMRYQGLGLSGAERRAIAEFVTGRSIRGTIVGATMGRCVKPAPPLGDPLAGPRWNGWGP